MALGQKWLYQIKYILSIAVEILWIFKNSFQTGVYTCNAYNDLGNAKASIQVPVSQAFLSA